MEAIGKPVEHKYFVLEVIQYEFHTIILILTSHKTNPVPWDQSNATLTLVYVLHKQGFVRDEIKQVLIGHA